MIDLRSDTVTQPTTEMRARIAEAPVGDDVYQDDPTVLMLEAMVSEILGKDDAVYMPTGTMTNQVAIRTHTKPGDVVLASRSAHINNNELGAANALGGVTIVELESERGVFTSDAVTRAIPEPPPGKPAALFQPVTLLALENTHNGAGGAIWPLEAVREVTRTAREHGVALHLDGARLWNATAASGVAESDYAAPFDTVSVCFSKGLGAPMGSALVGAQGVIDEARRFKQMYGGGFRQAGMMAAGAIYALEHHRDRLAEDHANAMRVATVLAAAPGIEVDLDAVVTNMVYFRVTSKPAAEFAVACGEQGVRLNPTSRDIVRIVFHLGVSEDDADRAAKVMSEAAR